MTRKNIHAYTEIEYKEYPAYVSINHEPDSKEENWWESKAELIVRSAENGGQKTATLNMTLSDLEKLAIAIFEYVYEAEKP